MKISFAHINITYLCDGKLVRMFMVVVGLFIFCWLPYQSYFVYQFIDDKIASYKYIQPIFLSFYWLAMSNAMINPLIYYFMNTRYRFFVSVKIAVRTFHISVL